MIAQQVIQLQGAVQKGEKRTVFEGTDIVVNPEFAVYITMNPGYAGRAELPDNLEALFRPVSSTALDLQSQLTLLLLLLLSPKPDPYTNTHIYIQMLIYPNPVLNTHVF